MNANFDGGNGLYGSVLLGALAELDQLFNKPRSTQGRPWKSMLVTLAMVATAAVLVGGLGA